MVNKTIQYLFMISLLVSCDFLQQESDILPEKRVLIYTESSDPLVEISNIVITISSKEFKDIVVETTDSLFYSYIPKGKDRKIEVLATLTDGRLFYGKRFLDIDSRTDRVEIRVGDSLYGDINIVMDDLSIGSVDVGLGNDQILEYGSGVTLNIVRKPSQNVRGWFVNGEHVSGNYSDTLVLTSDSLLEGEHVVTCLLSEKNIIQEDKIRITIIPKQNIYPSIGNAISFTPGGALVLAWEEASDGETTQDKLIYKIVASRDLSQVDNVISANSPEVEKIVAGWGKRSGDWYSYTTPTISLNFSLDPGVTWYVTVLVSDKYGNISMYPPQSGVF